MYLILKDKDTYGVNVIDLPVLRHTQEIPVEH